MERKGGKWGKCGFSLLQTKRIFWVCQVQSSSLCLVKNFILQAFNVLKNCFLMIVKVYNITYAYDLFVFS